VFGIGSLWAEAVEAAVAVVVVVTLALPVIVVCLSDLSNIFVLILDGFARGILPGTAREDGGAYHLGSLALTSGLARGILLGAAAAGDNGGVIFCSHEGLYPWAWL
jgi:hypothetical protein